MIINRAPEWDGSATAEPKYDPFGEPSRKGTRKPWPNFCQAFRVLLRGGGSAHQNPGVLLASVVYVLPHTFTALPAWARE